MCTVTFIPRNKTGFILTSNRDEQTQRLPSLEPASYKIYDSMVVFPKDTQADGTWIATNGVSFTLCLLNGAFEKHERKLPYNKSRGLVLLDFFQYNHVDRFLKEYRFNGIEPFTLLLVEHANGLRITEARWDEMVLHRKEVDAGKPHIWSSATLYTPEVISDREGWFKKFLDRHQEFNTTNILDFHHFAGQDDPENSVLMNRNNQVRTVSITSITFNPNNTQITYKDMISGKIYNSQID